MTRNTDAKVVSDPGPCEGCRNRRACGDLNRPKACTAYEQFEAGEPARNWRDASREPSEVIARRLLIRWHGNELVDRAYPQTKAKLPIGDALLRLLAASDDPSEVRRVARLMREDGYAPADVARIMKLSLIEARELMGLAATG